MSKTKTLAVFSTLAMALTLLPACSQEISHTESDKPGWFGGRTHTEETTYKNPDGSISHEREQIKVNP